MSYILDALRRADSERERGGVPGLHAHDLPPLTGDELPASRVAPWIWVAAGLGALVVGAFAWIALQPEEPAATPIATAPLAVQPALGQQLPALAPPPAAPAAHVPSAQVPPVQAPSAHVPAPRPATASPLPSPAAPVQPPAMAAPARASSAAPATPAQPSPSGRASPSDAVATAPRVQALHELPEPVRRAIPPLVVNGSVYSRNPADRFLIINGQIVHESDSVAPDVVLEQIGPRSAVLSTLGHRFEISY
jgi:general secretion pathway protein B